MLKYLLDKIAFAAGLILGMQLPKFIADYRQRVGGRLDQAQLDLEPYQEIANRFQHGSLDALVQHHLGSPDASFHAEGTVVQALIAQVQRLSEAYAALDTNLWQQIIYLARHIDPKLARATLEAYVPGLLLTPDALVCAFVLAFAFSLVVHAIAALPRRIGGRKRRIRLA